MTWVKIQASQDNKSAIYLPHNLSNKLPAQVELQFGQKKKLVAVIATEQINLENNQYINPVSIQFSHNLVDELLINELPTYQLSFYKNTLHLGPIVGLLLGDQRYYYHNCFMREFTDHLTAYEKIGGLIIAFKECGIDWKNLCVYGLYYNPSVERWNYGKFPMPSVVFRRAFKRTDSLFTELNKITAGQVFNSLRLDKWQLYDKLKQYGSIKPYLPDTEKLQDTQVLNRFLAQYPWIILKPTDLSRGRGICVIERLDEDNVIIHDYSQFKPQNSPLKKWELPSYLRLNHFFNRDYIIQQYLDLAKINGCPWDIRVIMQKNQKQIWQCSGIECRMAGVDSLLTNVSRGGQALYISQAAQLAFGPKIHPRKFKKDIIKIAKIFCEIMDDTDEHFAEFGLDLAIDVNQNYWFIEANVRPSFNGFKSLNFQTYLGICQTPILYAASRAGFGRGGDFGNKV